MHRSIRLSLAAVGAGVAFFLVWTVLWNQPRHRSAQTPPSRSHTAAPTSVKTSASPAGYPKRAPTPVPAPSARRPAFDGDLISNRDRFPNAEILAVEHTVPSNGEFTRIRLLRVEDLDGPVRVEERFEEDSDENWIMVRQSAMRADRLLAMAKSDEALANLRNHASNSGLRLEQNSPGSKIYRVILTDHSLNAVRSALAGIAAAIPSGILTDPDFLYFPEAFPNDPAAPRQYAIRRTEMDIAWEHTTGSDSIVIAVIDTGMDLNHPDLAANLWENEAESNGAANTDDDGNGFLDDVNGWDFASDDNNPDDFSGHGSHVSGILGARGNNGIGVTGVNWRVKIIPLRVGSSVFSDANLLAAMQYVHDLKVNRGVPIVATNNSYGGANESSIFEDVLEDHRDAGIVFVAAAGNSAKDNDIVDHFPSDYQVNNVLAVAATDGTDSLASFQSGGSNFGSTTVHLGAPGDEVYSTHENGNYDFISGTSMATPQVTGAVALVKAANPSLTGLQIRQLILDTVDAVPSLQGITITGGRLNVRRAVEESLGIVRSRMFLSALDAAPTRLASSENGILVEAVFSQDGQIVDNPDANVTWDAFPAGAGVQLEDNGQRKVAATFPGDGDYRVRATYTEAAAVIQTRDVFVRVGDGAVLANDLSAHWPFDDGNGSLAADSSGSGRDGTVQGATWDTGKVGGALRFDGIDDRVSFPAPSLSKYTVTAWINPSSDGLRDFPRIIDTPEVGVYLGRVDAELSHNENTLKFFANTTPNTTNIWNSPPKVIFDNTWYHIAIAYDWSDPSTSPHLYIDGVRLPVHAHVGLEGSRLVSTGTGVIGDRSDVSSLSRKYHGLIDDLRIYNRVLSGGEVAALATGPDLNDAPTVVAGDPLVATALEAVSLAGAVTDPDDGPQPATHTWEFVNGPGAPVIADSSALDTAVTFPAPGDYTLRLFADDGAATVFAELPVQVFGDPTLTLQLDADTALRNPGESVNLTIASDYPPNADINLTLTFSGSAAASVDYEALVQPIVFPADSTSVSVQIIPLLPGAPDPAATTLTITLDADDAYILGGATVAEIDFLTHSWVNWLQRYFHAAVPAGPETTILGDPDNDGIPNLVEYALGLHPNRVHQSVGDLPLPEVFVLDHETQSFLALRVSRPVGLADLTYDAQVSALLSPGNWLGVGTGTELFQVDPLAPGTETAVFRNLTPIFDSGGRDFFRLEVILNIGQ